jgi:hypothetical protein
MKKLKSITLMADAQRWMQNDNKGILRLFKGELLEKLPPQTMLVLEAEGGQVIDEKMVCPAQNLPWGFGFWIPEDIFKKSLQMSVKVPGKDKCSIPVKLEIPKGASALPLVHEKQLYEYMLKREVESDVWPGIVRDFSVAEYLKKYNVIYEKPAKHWSEGLYIGNGITGGVVSGKLEGEQRLGLTKSDIWFTDKDGFAMGKGYACDIDLKYRPGTRKFFQKLSIGSGTVSTQHGEFNSRIWIDRDSSIAVINIEPKKKLELEITLSRRELPLLTGFYAAQWNGSWQRIASNEIVKTYEAELKTAEWAVIETFYSHGCAHLLCKAPNLSVVNSVLLPEDSKTRQDKCHLSFYFELKKAEAWSLLVATEICKPGMEDTTAAANAKKLKALAKKKKLPDKQKKAWEAFWSRSFVKLDDELQENLYYQGIYHMACTFSGNRAASFFGLTQPVDHCTWQDGFTSDAQTEMLTWSAFTPNHLAFNAPMFSTYIDVWRKASEKTPKPGAFIPHQFFPAGNGGNDRFDIVSHQYRYGSTAWHVMSFWYDYLYSVDKKFLREIAYPILRSAATAMIANMTREDGVYHCYESMVPEQDNTNEDNVYDRVCLQGLFEAVIAASEILKCDVVMRKKVKDVLKNMFPLPTDGKTIFDTMKNPHPYRCHPCVLMGLYPLALWPEGSKEYKMAKATFPVVTRLFGFHYEDRHGPIEGDQGGIEPNGHATSFLLAFAARLKDRAAFDRVFIACAVGRQLKRNGLRSICDPRHSKELEAMAIIEASSGQSAAIAELLVQSYPDQIEVFPCVLPGKSQKFAGLRAMGGYILSGEWTGEKIAFIAARSIAGGELNINAPWGNSQVYCRKLGSKKISKAEFPVKMQTGETVIFSQDKENLNVRKWTPRMKNNREPLAIPVNLTDPCTPEVLYYPEDLLHGQEAENGHIFIGNPKKAPKTPVPVWSRKDALDNAGKADPALQQTAARILGRYDDENSRAVLEKLAGDPQTVIAATALVSLVRHDSNESDKLAKKLMKKIKNAYVVNEGVKAFARRRILNSGLRK